MSLAANAKRPSKLYRSVAWVHTESERQPKQKPQGVSGRELLISPTGFHMFTEEWETHFRKRFERLHPRAIELEPDVMRAGNVRKCHQAMAQILAMSYCCTSGCGQH